MNWIKKCDKCSNVLTRKTNYLCGECYIPSEEWLNVSDVLHEGPRAHWKRPDDPICRCHNSECDIEMIKTGDFMLWGYL
jgi:hypothetical protein